MPDRRQRPAGYTAAIYVSRAGFTPILYEGMAPGGQLTTTTRIENFPGFPDGIDGGVLMENMKQQAIRYGADIRMGAVTGVDFTMRPFRVTINGEKRIEAEALIIATGAEARYLGLESEQRFRGMACRRALRATAFSIGDRTSWWSAAAIRPVKRRPISRRSAGKCI